MNDDDLKRIRGFRALLHDGVKRGTDFVEKHHRHTAEKPFQVLESITSIAAPSRVVHAVHDGMLTLTYGGIRAINRATEAVDGWVIDTLESSKDEGDG